MKKNNKEHWAELQKHNTESEVYNNKNVTAKIDNYNRAGGKGKKREKEQNPKESAEQVKM